MELFVTEDLKRGAACGNRLFQSLRAALSLAQHKKGTA